MADGPPITEKQVLSHEMQQGHVTRNWGLESAYPISLCTYFVYIGA